jgi:CHASE2 domain-containing sensor protein
LSARPLQFSLDPDPTSRRISNKPATKAPKQNCCFLSEIDVIIGDIPDLVVSAKSLMANRLYKAAVGAGLAILCGLFLWDSKPGEAWENASYDYLFRFGARRTTNDVVLVLMDQSASEALGNGQPGGEWDRKWHTELLNLLSTNGSRLVVFDVFFKRPRDTIGDAALAAAIKRHGNVVLMAGVEDPIFTKADIARAVWPHPNFTNAAAGVGIALAGVDRCQTVRRPWAFTVPTVPGDLESLPWAAARLIKPRLSTDEPYQWLRYYAEGAWERASFHFALSNTPSYYSNKIVFVGSSPKDSDPRVVTDDKFCTPYTRWTHKAVGGVEIMATEFLNLVNGDWLRRLPRWQEALVLIGTGVLVGASLCQMRLWLAFLVGIGVFVAVMLAAVSWSYHTNYWFPWLMISGGQVPCALVWAIAAPKGVRASLVDSKSTVETVTDTVVIPGVAAKQMETVNAEQMPDAKDYQFFGPPFGEGGFGKVWLVRNAIGQWQALKAVYQSNFKESSHAYETEFLGVQRYKPISDKHPGLLRVDFVSRKKPEGYFYYVMELGDGLEPGWEQNPAAYSPRDLRRLLDPARSDKGRLAARECVRITLALTDSLEFLHGRGLTHRDIKPSNILFFNGHPKLADIGLVADILPTIERKTAPGTLGYMPPPPEWPGSPQADIYALGMVFYVMLTGRSPEAFPEVPSSLMDPNQKPDFRRLNAIVLKACQPDRTERYRSAAEMRAVLLEIWKEMDPGPAAASP